LFTSLSYGFDVPVNPVDIAHNAVMLAEKLANTIEYACQIPAQ